jgi:hypothetical protein
VILGEFETFLSFAIALRLQDQNISNSKETKLLQKIFKLALAKVKNYDN